MLLGPSFDKLIAINQYGHGETSSCAYSGEKSGLLIFCAFFGLHTLREALDLLAAVATDEPDQCSRYNRADHFETVPWVRRERGSTADVRADCSPRSGLIWRKASGQRAG